MKQVILRFGLLAAALLLLLQLSNYHLASRAWGRELLIGVVALVLIGMGIYLSRFITKPSRKESMVVNHQQIENLGISKREYEVLLQMALGKSNQQIAESLFISESTVKTHVSNLLVKLNAQRRTEAISIAQDMNIIL